MRLRIRETGGGWRQPGQRAHQNEDGLRDRLLELLRESPALVLGEEASLPPAVATEFPTPAGRIDLVAIDPQGQMTLCECKLARNPAIRREVVGQLLEYAGALKGLAPRRFREKFEERAQTTIAQSLRTWESEVELSERELFDAVEETLDTGQFRLLIVVDELGEHLKETLLYLNEQVSSAVLILELAYAKDDGLEFLLPTLHGQEAVSRSAPARSRKPAVLDADTVVVPAKFAYNDYMTHSAYICQPDRSFREEVQRMAFYKRKAIQSAIPQILARRSRVRFTAEECARLLNSPEQEDHAFAKVIERSLSSDAPTSRDLGSEHMVFLLTPSDDDRTILLDEPITHRGKSAWTQGQRYTRSDALRQASPDHS